ncbi:class I SAM-dependent methyltransferase [Ammonicoccus fulvus]|uniref:Class I SAM-dependent methyltransferase n=1 Tax=Ammonicoccus fulvus TaxID=3138240 RepID=A0ABZ3FRT6_9ACTN
MDPAVARRLVAEEGAAALALAAAQPDPGSLAAATALRRTVDADLAAAALSQIALRRRAITKFGDAASTLFFTPDALEQATRPDVARWRAERLAAAGVRRIVDLACGIGADSMAFLAAGLDVLAVERDEATAVLAEANLNALAGAPSRVLRADATEVDLADRTVFCDPARRTGAGRTWNVADFSPPWEFVTSLLDRDEGACLKLGPGVPHRLLPPRTLTEWVSHRGEAVEACVWSHHLAEPGRAAMLLPAADRLVATSANAPVGEVDAFLHEPDPAILASGGLGALAATTGAWRLHPEIAYLATSAPVPSPFWTSFRVLESFPWREKDLRQWVRDHAIGTLEIKKRGIDVDPAALRRRLKPKGPHRATIIITPTTGSAKVLVVERLGG